MELTINTAYAEQYEKKKQSEELSKLKEKYGSDIESDSSDSEEEDDNGMNITNKKRKEFLKTLSLLKEHDPRIYNKEIELYKQDVDLSESEQEKVLSTTPPTYLRDYERERVLKTRENRESDDGESEDEVNTRHSTTNLMYDKEQKSLRQDLLSVASDTSIINTLLTVRIKSKEEQEVEENDYVKWLKGIDIKLQSEDDANDMKTLQQYWTNPDIDKDEAFLRDYILNTMWINKDETRIPAYDEIVEDILSDDNDAVVEQDEFEHRYNFRYEEPSGSTIINYPRNVSSSVRVKDDRRKEKRKIREERKQLEKQQKQEELRRLKNLKKQEIFDKLEKLKKLTGNCSVGFTEDDIEGDFDANVYDKSMERVFDEEYYEKEGKDNKPLFSESEGEEDWDEWVPDTLHCEDPDFNMDADYNPEEDKDLGVSKRKRRRTSMFSRALHRKKPLFKSDEKSFEEYFDDYYKLDYEDVIGDTPCRFNYRSVVPNDFGLSTEEILTCDDRELNKWVSLKKAVQYRTKEEEKKDLRKYRKKATDVYQKKQILVSLKNLEEGETTRDSPIEDKCNSKKVKKSKKKKKKTLSESRLSAYGMTHAKKRIKKRKPRQ